MFNGFFTEIDEKRTFPDVVSNKMHEKHFFKGVVRRRERRKNNFNALLEKNVIEFLLHRA